MASFARPGGDVNRDDLKSGAEIAGKGLELSRRPCPGSRGWRCCTERAEAGRKRRAIGTILDPNGKAIAAIRQNRAFYGEVPILGTPYMTGYEPIKDSGGSIIGSHVDYKK